MQPTWNLVCALCSICKCYCAVLQLIYIIGNGSDTDRKAHIEGRFGSRSLFDEHRRCCKGQFRSMIQELQDELNEVVVEQIGHIESDLQMLKDENVVLESERYPEFRVRVQEEMGRVREEVERLGSIVGHV